MKTFKSVGVYILTVLLFAGLFVSCANKNKYAVSNYYTQEFIDSLMVEIVTYMGKKPGRADYITRHNPEHRPYYTELSREFYVYRLFVDNDGVHYYYIIRPARHPLGNLRAVGGKFRLGEGMNIQDFEEIFVTHVMNEQELKDMGNDLMVKLIEENHEEIFSNRKIIEWPDDRCHYDIGKKEWRYDIISGS